MFVAGLAATGALGGVAMTLVGTGITGAGTAALRLGLCGGMLGLEWNRGPTRPRSPRAR